MCFVTRVAATPTQQVVQSTTPSPAPTRAEARTSSLASRARLTLLRARGERDAIATSPLGDPGYGSGVRKPVLLGQTS